MRVFLISILALTLPVSVITSAFYGITLWPAFLPLSFALYGRARFFSLVLGALTLDALSGHIFLESLFIFLTVFSLADLAEKILNLNKVGKYLALVSPSFTALLLLAFFRIFDENAFSVQLFKSSVTFMTAFQIIFGSLLAFLLAGFVERASGFEKNGVIFDYTR